MERILSLGNVKFTYEGGVEALMEVSLEVRRGEYIALVGGNGSGKTTLAKHLNGLLRPTSGRIWVGGRDSADLTVAVLARTVGYAFQNPDHQLFCTSVEDEVRFGPHNLGRPDDEVRRLSETAMEVMGIADIRAKPPLTLSLGQRRRVSIAAVLAMDPAVLVLDEPTTGLDHGEARELMEILSGLNRDGKTVILITHDMRLVAEHATRVVIMSGGQIVLDSDVRGAFDDLGLLRDAQLIPPPISILAHRLEGRGVPADILTADEMVFHLELGRTGGG
jgi:energy-coupling factor transport system ATP-binding protein